MGDPVLIILVGLQAAGKTTFYRQRFADCAHVSKDLMRRARPKDRRQVELVTAALRAGRSVVVDNTNPTVADRAPLIALGHAFGARVVGYFFEPDIRASIARNQQRQGREQVPKVAILTTAKRLQPPTAEEGFDELYRVRMEREGEFTVQRQV